ncbi:DUF305 domain-containing protein [Streptomyces purpurascens]|uniref:DUF305 domain-containing protein n=1 Tax=Streptomyces purpurascens TaxID=1924 RepID=A0ABZ1MLY4_STREF|nr:DUF305 domain-containing protein [Streptomyces purpurascens]MCE7049494.1 DUF305 domain-containing protein [Streptomyces purpurascens]GHA22068.1 lipoprotein [Streptomyces purpurascens]
MNSTYSIRNLTRRAALVAAAGSATFVLAACGGDGGGNSGSGHDAHASASASESAGAEATRGAHNAQDVSFAQGMIPHHRQALEMARLADGRAVSGAVKDLAARVEKAQDPEIRAMTGWLKQWGEDAPEPADSMDHSGMPGMMGGEDMAGLEKLTGKAFDTQFLTLMVEHHEGAVKMAAVEKSKGRYGPAKAMAGDIVTAQNAEIREMNKLLGKSRG